MPAKEPRRKPFHFTAAGYVVSDGKVLLVSHRKLKKWLPPGGHMTYDEGGRFIETPEEAAIREIREETGYDVEICAEIYSKHDSDHEMLPIPESMHIHPIDEEHNHYGFDFFCRVKGREIGGKEEEKFRWFTAQEIEGYPHDAPIILPEHVRVMAVKAIEKIGFGI